MMRPIATPTGVLPMMKTPAFSAASATSPLGHQTIERREVGPKDVQVEVMYCGVCHSDIHTARNEWHGTTYPCVPGHEIIGRVAKIGAQVTKFTEGETVGVGCMVDSCRGCPSCKEGLEQYCEGGQTFTYNSEDKASGGITYRGYSTTMVVDQDFVLKVPANLDPQAAAPLLCAGITTYSPLRHWKVGKGQKVGVVGLGGLGHMGVKFAAAMGAHVVMISGSPDKEKDARLLGAEEFLLSKDEAAMKKHANSFDFILNTIPVGHDVTPYVDLLKRDATMVIVGAVEPLKAVNGGQLIFRRKNIAGSLIGGIKETQEMLDFCGKHNITCEVETIPMQDINDAFERTVKGDVKYRFVIDMESLRKSQSLDQAA